MDFKEILINLKNYILFFLGILFMFLTIGFLADGTLPVAIIMFGILTIICFYFSRNIFKFNMKWFEKLPLDKKTNILEMCTKLKSLNPNALHTMKGSFNNKYRLYKIIYQLLQNISNDEEILFFSVGKILSSTTYIYITNKKIIITNESVKSIQYEKINTIENGYDYIKIITNSETIINSISTKDINKLANEIRNNMELHKNIDINITRTTEKDVADKIAKLKVLYDEGILTEFEFNMKKMELLDKAH